jgi:hypothetical protein
MVWLSGLGRSGHRKWQQQVSMTLMGRWVLACVSDGEWGAAARHALPGRGSESARPGSAAGGVVVSRTGCMHR